MSRRITKTLLLAALLGSLWACAAGLTAVSSDNTFSFTAGNDVSYTVDFTGGDFTWLEGHNVASGDYTIVDNVITLKANYLSTLAPGTYEFTAASTAGMATLSVVIADEHNRNRIYNGGFETGDLTGWTAQTTFKGEDALLAYVPEAVLPNAAIPGLLIPFGGLGDFVYGFTGTGDDAWTEKTGILRSRSFTLGGSGWITYRLGGGDDPDFSYLSVIDAETGEEVARYGNTAFLETDYLTDPEHYFGANLASYKADLTAFLGRTLYLQIVDRGGQAWDYLTFDAFETYHAAVPTAGTLAIDIRPTFAAVYVTNQIPNGNFAAGLTGWIASGTAFRVTDGILRSNEGGDAATGILRSGLFRIDGSGVVSLRIGAAQGARFDKDTYVSIKERGTNQELFRLANVRHDGNTLQIYYVDLSDYLGTECYIEIVDNAIGSWDTIFVDDIITYYATAPDYDFGQAGSDLNV